VCVCVCVCVCLVSRARAGGSRKASLSQSAQLIVSMASIKQHCAVCLWVFALPRAEEFAANSVPWMLTDAEGEMKVAVTNDVDDEEWPETVSREAFLVSKLAEAHLSDSRGVYESRWGRRVMVAEQDGEEEPVRQKNYYFESAAYDFPLHGVIAAAALHRETDYEDQYLIGGDYYNSEKSDCRSDHAVQSCCGWYSCNCCMWWSIFFQIISTALWAILAVMIKVFLCEKFAAQQKAFSLPRSPRLLTTISS